MVVFDSNEDYQKALMGGLWFWGSAGIFLTPWFLEFNPSIAVINKPPIWFRLPNLPAHFWHFIVFLAIGNTLGHYLDIDTSRKVIGLYTYSRQCAEIDISKGLPDQINLKFGDFHWTQPLDYKNTAFRFRHCHQTGHLQKEEEYEADVQNNEETKADMQNDEIPMDAPSIDLVVPSHPQISHKRSRLSSSSDSDKDIPPLVQNSLQLVMA
eukprot:PITA_28504